MARIMNEWEVQKVSSNFDRINTYYKKDPRNAEMMYLRPEEMTEIMSEWDVQKVASNLDRIAMNRRPASTSSNVMNSLLAGILGIILVILLCIFQNCPTVAFILFFGSAIVYGLVTSIRDSVRSIRK